MLKLKNSDQFSKRYSEEWKKTSGTSIVVLFYSKAISVGDELFVILHLAIPSVGHVNGECNVFQQKLCGPKTVFHIKNFIIHV
jgi:hypothetical protein